MIHAVPKPPPKAKKPKTRLKVHKHLKAKNKNPLPRKIRDEVFERDGHQCLECGAIDGLQPHHIDKQSQASKEWKHDPRNIWILCWKCHQKTEDEPKFHMYIQRKAVARFDWFAGREMSIEEYDEKYGRN